MIVYKINQFTIRRIGFVLGIAVALATMTAYCENLESKYRQAFHFKTQLSNYLHEQLSRITSH